MHVVVMLHLKTTILLVAMTVVTGTRWYGARMTGHHSLHYHIDFKFKNSSVSGDWLNLASGQAGSVTGGYANMASGAYSSVSGGNTSSATTTSSWAAGTLLE